MDAKITEAVVEALNSGWITTGPRTKLFEKKLTEFNGNKATLCVNSASGGLELMLKWFGIGAGDEVILPAYTYAATANVIIHTGATPVFVDSNSDFNISARHIEAAITKNTKAIMPVDLGGWPCDYDSINQIVNKEEIKRLFQPTNEQQQKLGRILVLSDAAHSLGAIYKGRPTGSLTDITVFSFHAVKNLTTAEGGAIALNLPEPFDNEEVYKYLNIKSLHGQSKDALAKTQIGNWRYDILEAGYKYNMTDIQAAMGLVELERYKDDMLVRRKQIFDRYSMIFGEDKRFLIPEYQNQESTSSYHVYLLRINEINEKQRDEIIRLIFEQQVTVNVHFIPLPMMTFYKSIGYKIENYPICYKNYSCEISLPVYYTLSNEQVDQVANAVIHAVDTILK